MNTRVPQAERPLQQREFDYRRSKVRYLEGGSGFPILLMHGAGPGASVATAFAKIIEDVAARYHVFAMDLLGFGQSGEMPGTGRFDFGIWVAQAEEMLRRMPQGNVGIFGHSVSGAIALRIAACDERVTHLFTTGSVGSKFTLNEHLNKLWTFPKSKTDLRDSLKSLMFDSSDITDAIIEQRWQVLGRSGYSERFERLFAGNKQELLDSSEISVAELGRIRARVAMVHGREDLPCPPSETTLKIVQHVPQADVTLLARCGHAPSVEHPHKIKQLMSLAFAGATP